VIYKLAWDETDIRGRLVRKGTACYVSEVDGEHAKVHRISGTEIGWLKTKNLTPVQFDNCGPKEGDQ